MKRLMLVTVAKCGGGIGVEQRERCSAQCERRMRDSEQRAAQVEFAEGHPAVGVHWNNGQDVVYDFAGQRCHDASSRVRVESFRVKRGEREAQ